MSSDRQRMVARLKCELPRFQTSPPHGIQCWVKDDAVMDRLQARIFPRSRPVQTTEIQGPEDTPYECGLFLLDVHVGQRYPLEPPSITFVTPVHHPNVDAQGRICMDTLKMPPKGAWRPSMNIEQLLTSIRLLLANPNPDDPLSADIVRFAMGLI
jgi:ubiquitin-conjugating enzyme E2 T